ncbi:MAG: dihydroorotate dehydrogenase (quinone) [Bdellovibrionales bacterium RIFOXYD1_FULL_53_11]|nr:MAG: dihydroorotate dehydrogenase (quinone) [Bdellovibrionales bacterium RIFOXYD1_FULL_53_11]
MAGLRRAIWRFARKIFFLTDAEKAHQRALRAIRICSAVSDLPLRLASGVPLVSGWSAHRALGMDFISRVGLAGGFDKDARIVRALPALGFGFAEIGTVTPRPQSGNPRPRLFRDVERNAIFNKMGFNNDGAVVVSERLRRARGGLPAGFRVGVNIGKNKDTPLEAAAGDYMAAARCFEGLADFFVINVSSPNTPGLRALQEPEALKPIIEGVGGIVSTWWNRPPVLLKLAPELAGTGELERLIKTVEPWGVDGWVLTNTLAGAYMTKRGEELSGGWSGEPLSEKARSALLEARAATGRTIISVGGIMNPEEARARILVGADLVQVYTGWIFGGPSFPVEIARTLAMP